MPQTNIGEQIEKLAQSNYTPYQVVKIDIGIVEEKTAQLIIQTAGIDISHYKHQVDNYGLWHALKKHSGKVVPLQKNELPLTSKDFRLIPAILKNPDRIEYVGKTQAGGGLPALKYTKRFNGITYYIEEMRAGKRTLSLKTMYKTKTPPGAKYAASSEAPTSVRPSHGSGTPTPSGIS